MSVMEKSDLLIVAMKRANKAVSAVAEPVERRGGAKENAELQSTVRTQSRVAVSQAQVRIREAVFTRGAVSSSPSKVGARCVSSARRDLCGGRREIFVPTATARSAASKCYDVVALK
jgi:hypothetical protein